MRDNEYKKGESAYIFLVGSGRGGLTAFEKGSPNATISIPDRRFRPYYGDMAENGVILDKSTCPEGKLMDGVLNGPMVDPFMPEGTEEKCPQPDPAFAAALEGTFQTLATKKVTDPGWRGLDKVPLKEYLEYWRERGARVGHRHGSIISWEDESYDTIPTAETRWQG